MWFTRCGRSEEVVLSPGRSLRLGAKATADWLRRVLSRYLFVIRALDWLRAAISALPETCMRRLGLVGWAAADSVFAACLGEAPRAPFRSTLTEICCSKRWYCGLRFPVDFSAAAWLARTIATAFVSDDGSKFGRARPSARCDVRPASKLRPSDAEHPGRRQCAPYTTVALAFDGRRAARQK